MRSRLAAALVAVIAICVLSACTREVTGPSLVLRLATPDDASDPTTSMQVQHFAEQVNSLSHGTIRVDPVLDADAGAPAWDQVVARGVAAGTWDLGLVPGRAWDELGVRSLRALNTPFLVTSPAALGAVLDSDLRDRLMAGLPAAGVVGLDIFPDGMRHPFGYTTPLLGPEDYRGAIIRTARSATVAMLFDDLGAAVTDADPDSSVQRGAESEFATTQASIATANVTFFPKTDVLVGSSAVHQRLRSDQWALLRSAAAATRVWTSARLPSDFEAASTFCDHGGRIVAASAQQISEIRSIGAKVTANLMRDGETRPLIDGIRSVTAGLPAPAPITRCPGSAAGVSTPARLDGVYETDVTAKVLRAAGETNEQRIRENTGHFTWTLRAGNWTYHQTSELYVANPQGSGRYTYENGVFTLFWSSQPGGWTRAHLTIGKSGTVAFTGIVDGQPGNQALSEGFFRTPWRRVGKTPTS